MTVGNTRTPISYGTPSQLSHMLDVIGHTLAEEPREQWHDHALRASTRALRDQLDALLQDGQ